MYNQTKPSSKSRRYLILGFIIFAEISLHRTHGEFNELSESLRQDYRSIFRSGYYDDEGDVIPSAECEEDSYQCNDGKCINGESLCDGLVDCTRDADDERECERCPPGFYKCFIGSCINETLICDGKKDCKEFGDDEEDCDKVAHCAKTKARCRCIVDLELDDNEIVCFSTGLTSIPNRINQAITRFDFRYNKLGLFEGLSDFTFSPYPHMKTLDLKENEITRLSSRVFENLTNLRALTLSDNQITTLDADTFKDLRRVERLDLGNNRIAKLPSKIFSNLSKLGDLTLAENKIAVIEDDSFAGLKNLNMLSLSNNSITNLTSWVFSNLSRLTTLEIELNDIRTIADDAFASLENLWNLDMSSNSIPALTSTMFKNTKELALLRLDDNKIATIENDTFNELVKLVYLYLNGNRITKLTAHMFDKMNELTVLNLQGNAIRTIEDHAFAGLTKLQSLNLGNNYITVVTPNTFQTTGNWTSLNLNYNNISTIEDFAFLELSFLNDLSLKSNNISILRPETFANLEYLYSLELSENRISLIEDFTFDSLVRLRELHLDINNIPTLPSLMFQNMPELDILNVSRNSITDIGDYAFQGLINLRKLDVSFNRVKKLTSTMFRGLSDLVMLYLQSNEIVSIESSTFNGLGNLVALNLSDNRITTLEEYTFEGLNNLRGLLLRNNKITTMQPYCFYGLRSLKFLNLAHNEIEDVNENVFKSAPVLKHLLTDEHRFCCLKKDLTTCIPAADEFSSCNDLMANSMLRISIWIQGIIAIVANLFVIIFRSGKKNSNLNKVNSFLIRNLALSDLFMGIYLLIIAFVDLHYRGKYYLYDFEWRMSLLCNFAGFMSTFSSELTVFTLTVITVDRLFSIAFPFRIQQREINRTRILMAIVWLLAAILASVPLPIFNIDYFVNFYGRSGVCLPLHITNHKANGWQYSVFIFIILNAISFAVITLSYILMYWSTRQTRKAVSRSNQLPQTSMAFRMTLLVLTDAACWIPIIILGVRSLVGYTVSPNVYAWIAVFVLPLNAALNPILYTISSIPLVISFQKNNTRFNGQLKFRWPCYWKKPEENIASLNLKEKRLR